jgi:hypothetical protein
MARWPWSRDSDAVKYRREGGMPPPDHEVLTINQDGRYQLWRTMARASRPPSPVGRFSGSIPAEEWSGLRRAIDACRGADAIELSLPPDAAQEKVILGKRISSWADDATPPPPFDALTSELRRLLGALTKSPEAAITLSLDGTSKAMLRHVGTDKLELNMSMARVRAVRREDDAAVEEWTAELNGPDQVIAEPGWEYDLPFDHSFGDARVTAHVDDLLAFDGEFWRACSLQTIL